METITLLFFFVFIQLKIWDKYGQGPAARASGEPIEFSGLVEAVLANSKYQAMKNIGRLERVQNRPTQILKDRKKIREINLSLRISSFSTSSKPYL